jgi:predicted DCC family thiol-disulfide oxidoreductase YuxK
VYNFIARNRYRWFGKKDACWIPGEEWKEKFLN